MKQENRLISVKSLLDLDLDRKDNTEGSFLSELKEGREILSLVWLGSLKSKASREPLFDGLRESSEKVLPKPEPFS